MLSDDLKAVELFLNCVGKRQIDMNYRDLAGLTRIIISCRQMAEAMERHSVVARTVTAEDLRDGRVVLFPVTARPVRRGPAGSDPCRGGGDGAA